MANGEGAAAAAVAAGPWGEGVAAAGPFGEGAGAAATVAAAAAAAAAGVPSCARVCRLLLRSELFF